jgi:hypothetical protein
MADKTDKTVEELQKQLLEAQLRTQKAILDREEAGLEQTLESTSTYKQKREVAARTNAARQRQFTQDQRNLRDIQRNKCEHRSGGYAGESSILEGDGPSVLSVTIMPDNKTKFIQCPRCVLALYGRDRNHKEEAKMEMAAEAVEKKNPNFDTDPVWLKWHNHVWWKELIATHKKFAYKKSIMRGPTFTFENEQGVPFIPELR